MATKVSTFKTDLIFGQDAENRLLDLIEGKGFSVEVKRDAQWIRTGNLFIEFECFYQATGHWGPSGISTTEADLWAFDLEGLWFIVPIETLRYAFDSLGAPTASNKTEPNPSTGKLLTINGIVSAHKVIQKDKND